MPKVNLTIGNVTITCNHYDEATKIAKPFVEKMVPVNITPVWIQKPINKSKEETINE